MYHSSFSKYHQNQNTRLYLKKKKKKKKNYTGKFAVSRVMNLVLKWCKYLIWSRRTVKIPEWQSRCALSFTLLTTHITRLPGWVHFKIRQK